MADFLLSCTKPLCSQLFDNVLSLLAVCIGYTPHLRQFLMLHYCMAHTKLFCIKKRVDIIGSWLSNGLHLIHFYFRNYEVNLICLVTSVMKIFFIYKKCYQKNVFKYNLLFCVQGFQWKSITRWKEAKNMME